MDPNQALRELRTALAASRRAPGDTGYLRDVADSAQALDDWLSDGGFLPTDWMPKQDTHWGFLPADWTPKQDTHCTACGGSQGKHFLNCQVRS